MQERQHIEQLEAENARLRADLNAFQRSRFWLATKPLRALTGLAKKLLGRKHVPVAQANLTEEAPSGENNLLRDKGNGNLPVRKMPWETGLCERIAAAEADLAAGRRVALYLYEQADASTFRYRVYNVCKALEQSDIWRGAYFFRDELYEIEPLIERCGAVTVVRVRWNPALQRIVDLAREHYVPILFDVDDLVFDMAYMPLVTTILNIPTHHEYNLDVWVSHIARVELTAGFADGFTTTNEYLGDILHKKFGREVRIVPNALNREQIDASAEAVRHQRRNERFTIGYFSGTATHVNDFNVAAPELARLLAEHPDMVLKVVGFMEFPPCMAPFIESGQVVLQPLVDFIELQRLIAEVDVNIVPLVDNLFTNCKSELKYFEAAIVDTLTAATPTYAYRNAITHMENGLLCREGEWRSAIEAIYQNRIPAAEIVARAHSHAVQTYYGAPFLRAIEDALDYFSHR